LKAAVKVTALSALTHPAVVVKLAVVDPAATVTLDGTLRVVASPEERFTTAPPVGAACCNVTVAVEVEPDIIVAALRSPVSLLTFGFTVTMVLATPFSVAVMLPVTLRFRTVPVVTVKLAVVAPAATVTDAGTGNTPGLLDEIATTDPPAGAAGVTVTVQTVLEPDTTELGEHTRPETAVDGAGGVTVTEVVTLPFNVAVTVTV